MQREVYAPLSLPDNPLIKYNFGVLVFPGSNCDVDCYHVVARVLGCNVSYVWHEQTSLDGYDCVIIPGGFSYGDYLRAGAIARFSPVMKAVREFAGNGGLVLGICNGFQILLEAGLLPGAMMVNDVLEFRCQFTYLRVENNNTPFTVACKPGQVLKIPIAHYQGNYFASNEVLDELNRRCQVVLRYCDESGRTNPEANPNGSVDNIAAVCNEQGNVMGMMPHPERACEKLLGSTDGLFILKSIVATLEREGSS